MNRSSLSRRGVLRGLSLGLAAGSAGCTGLLSGRDPKSLPILNGVTVSSYDPETKHLHVTISRGETVVYETTLAVDGFDREQNRELGTAVIPPSKFEQEPARWTVTASLDADYTETLPLADEASDGEKYIVLIRIGEHESIPDARDFALTAWGNGEDEATIADASPGD